MKRLLEIPLAHPSAFAKPTAEKSDTLSPSDGDSVRGFRRILKADWNKIFPEAAGNWKFKRK
ncbi:MAG: hypothetical protein HY735_14210 [Verrucomicrobia bacterium]|nr:hypothetical protein [Verrucomicrobiota bacterium]